MLLIPREKQILDADQREKINFIFILSHLYNISFLMDLKIFFYFFILKQKNLEMEIRVKTLADPDKAKLCRSGIRNNAVRCTVYSLYTVIYVRYCTLCMIRDFFLNTVPLYKRN